MRERVIRDLTSSDMDDITKTFKAWRRGDGYADRGGFCRSVNVREIEAHKWALIPGRYVGFSELDRPKLASIDIDSDLSLLADRLRLVTETSQKALQIMKELAHV